MLEIESTVVVVVFIFLKHNGQCGRLANSNYFYTKESIPSVHELICTRNAVCVHVTCTVVVVHTICGGLSTDETLDHHG